MPKVTLLRNSPMGRAGQVREIESSATRAAFALGLAEPFVEPPKSKRVYRKKTETETEGDTPKPKRSYKRKDMEAESDPVVIQSPDPEPLENPLDDSPEDEPDAPVRLGD